MKIQKNYINRYSEIPVLL